MGDTPRHRLVVAAIESFADKGFHGTTTRDIAAHAGMSPAALYARHESKESLLFALSLEGHKEACNVLLEASQSSDDPIERLRAMIYSFTYWHAVNSRMARINQYELAALSSEHLEIIAKYRRTTAKLMRDAVRYGVDAGAFQVADIPGTALAMLSLGIDLARWFQPEGSRSAKQVATLYAGLGLRMAGVA
jgi:AcrR family transcriptional regulator